MVRIWNNFGFAVLFLVVLSACDRGTFDRERSATQGSLMARLHTLPGVSKAEQVELDVPPIDAFVVSVCSVSVATPVYSSLYSAFPYSLNLTEGSYTIEAAHGQNVPFTTEDPYYFVQQPFEIARGEATSVELKACLVGFGVEGFFDADMADHFASWRLEAEIDQVWDASYRWAEQGEKPRAYFLPGTVRVILRGVRHNGQAFSKVIKEISSPLGRELYTLNIHVLPAGHALSVRVDTERRVVTDQGVVSVDALPDLEAPVLGAMTFYETTTVPAEGLAATAELRSFVGFSEVEITAPRAGYGLEARAYRWSDGADRAALRLAGVDLGADDLSNSRTATLSAKGLVNRMLADASVERGYDLAVAVTDGTGKVGVSTLPILIERPEFTLPTIGAAACWSRTVYLPQVEAVVDKGDAALIAAHAEFSYQISADGGATWGDISSTELAAVGLMPDTEYLFRARFRDVYSAVVGAQTEAMIQVPNGNMDQWNIEMWANGTGKDMPRYRAWASGATDTWWANNNDRTVRYEVFKSAYNCFPAVSYVAGRSGKAAELRTISGSGGGINSISSESSGNRTPGRLFLGAYEQTGGFQSNGETITRGQPFATRPSKMSFYYQYEPWGSNDAQGGDDEFCGYIELYNGTTLLGRGEFKHKTSGRACITSWTQAQVVITYSNTTLKADKIVVDFVTTTDPAPKVSTKWARSGAQYKSGKTGNDYGNGCPTLADFNYGDKMWQYYGSVLKLDDIELIYEK